MKKHIKELNLGVSTAIIDTEEHAEIKKKYASEELRKEIPERVLNKYKNALDDLTKR